MTSERRKQIRRRRKRKQKNKFLTWFKKLSVLSKILFVLGIIIACMIITIITYLAVMLGKVHKEDIDEKDIHINELDASVGEGYTNFVLFGGDSRSGNVTKNLNTDSIIIVSLNNETKQVKLVSVYRDTLLDLTNGKIRKCNSAYSNGGAKQAINMLNMNLDLDIKDHVTVNFAAVADVIDMVGGIEIDVSAKEYKEVNRFIGETARVVGKKAKYLTHAGVQTLDGVQATTYARIRKNVGNDFARTERQRLVIEKVVEKAIRSDLATIHKIIDKVAPNISTSLSSEEILSYAADFAKYSIGETAGFPFVKGSGTIPGRGSSVYPITLEKNVSQLHEFLYGTKDYQPSSKVVEISGEIAYIVGNRKPDKDTTSTGNNNNTPEDPTTDNPEDPNNPTNPEEPNNPDNPTNPEDPNNPDNPTNPEDPNNPNNPINPEEPNNPDNPTNPEEPSNPDNPNNPESPTNPENPDNPTEQPTSPGTPNEGNQSGGV